MMWTYSSTKKVIQIEQCIQTYILHLQCYVVDFMKWNAHMQTHKHAHTAGFSALDWCWQGTGKVNYCWLHAFLKSDETIRVLAPALLFAWVLSTCHLCCYKLHAHYSSSCNSMPWSKKLNIVFLMWLHGNMKLQCKFYRTKWNGTMPNMGENKSCVGFGGFGEKRVRSVHTPFFSLCRLFFFVCFRWHEYYITRSVLLFFFLLIAVEYILQTKWAMTFHFITEMVGWLLVFFVHNLIAIILHDFGRY